MRRRGGWGPEAVLIHPIISGRSPMSSTARDLDYYDLAEKDYSLTRAAIEQIPPATTPASLSPEKLRKLVSS